MNTRKFDIIISEADLADAIQSYELYLENLEQPVVWREIEAIMQLGEGFWLFRIETDPNAAAQLAEFIMNWLVDTNRQYILYFWRRVVLNRLAPSQFTEGNAA